MARAGRSRGAVVVGTAALMAISLIVVLVGFGVGPQGSQSTPTYAGNFPDPFVLRTSSGYWAYGTGTGSLPLQVMYSPNLHDWSRPWDPLARLPSWAQQGDVWAPAVIKRNQVYIIYYSAVHAATGRHCIAVATAASPAGPFANVAGSPVVCQPTQGGSIDPDPFVGSSGREYLLWKDNGNTVGETSRIWSARLSGDGLTLAGNPKLLIHNDEAWQGHVLEGPDMVTAGGRIFLFYGANNWKTGASGMGYAVCSTPLGPCIDQSTRGPWLGTGRFVVGPSGPDVFTGQHGHRWLAFAAWSGGVGYGMGAVRALWIQPLEIVAGVPSALRVAPTRTTRS